MFDKHFKCSSLFFVTEYYTYGIVHSFAEKNPSFKYFPEYLNEYYASERINIKECTSYTIAIYQLPSSLRSVALAASQ